jgi:phage-related protein
MAFDGTDPCWKPTWPVTTDREPRMNTAKFGDGYEQRTLDGINSMNSTWKLKWTMRPISVLAAMDAYLTNAQAGAFPFLIPGTTTVVNVFCDKWSTTLSYQGSTNDYGDLDAEFRIANGVAIAGAMAS